MSGMSAWNAQSAGDTAGSGLYNIEIPNLEIVQILQRKSASKDYPVGIDERECRVVITGRSIIVWKGIDDHALFRDGKAANWQIMPFEREAVQRMKKGVPAG